MYKILITSLTITLLLLPAQVREHNTYSNIRKITIHSEEVVGDRTAETNNQIETKKVETRKVEKTIYDLYSKEECEILFRIVEAECTGLSKQQKKNVANVILNRVESDIFPDTIKEVVFQKTSGIYQFSPIADKRYYSVTVTDETIEACEEAVLESDNAYGALFFDAYVNSWASNNKKYVFEDGKHKFYK